MWRDRARSWLEAPALGRRLALLAVVLALPSLANGLALDDYIHQGMVRSGPAVPNRAAWNLFDFVSPDGDIQALIDGGWLPWWTFEKLRVRFLRPLTSLSHAVDYALFRAPAVAHAINLLCFGVLVLLVTRLYRRIEDGRGSAHEAVRPLPVWVAGLAAFFFAVDDAHGTGVGWLASRNGLLAALFSVGTLSCHDAWRRDGARARAPLAAVLYALALFSGEIAFSLIAFFVAYALCVEGAKGAWRFFSVAPYLALAGGWLAVLASFDYGVAGSGLYVSPLGEPGRFARAALERIPLLLTAALAGIPSDLWSFATDTQRAVLVAGSALLCALFGWALIGRSCGRRPTGGLPGDPAARFWGLALVLSTIPIAGTFPNDRLLWFVGLAAMPLVARLVQPLFDAGARETGRRVAAMVLLAVHGVLGPLLLPVRSVSTLALSRDEARAARQLAAAGALGDVVAVVNAPEPHCSMARWHAASTGNRSIVRCLGATRAPVQVRRVALDTLVLIHVGGLLPTRMDTLLRARSEPFSPGETLVVPGLTIRVQSVTADGRPLETLYRFDGELDRGPVWLYWHNGGFEPFVLPPVGRSVMLPES